MTVRDGRMTEPEEHPGGVSSEESSTAEEPPDAGPTSEPDTSEPDTSEPDTSEPDTSEPAVPEPPTAKRRKLLYVTLPGCWGAVILSCLSFTPSLLPRTGVTQGLIWGISAAIGYGIGVLVASIWRAFADREARPAKRRSWFVFAVVGGVLLVVSFALGQYWQHLLRVLMGVTEYNIALVVASPVFAAVMFCLIIAIGRGVRGIFRWLASLLGHWIGPRAARAVGWIAVVTASYLLVSGLLLDGLRGAVNEAFSVKNNTTPAGVHQPTSPLRSGGPGSLVPWDTIGYEGKKFVATGPTAADIERFTHKPAMEPVRAYAGLESADDSEDRASLAVRDLARAGGFHRKNLLVVTTTGSGWVDPASVNAFEYLSGGDSAIVAMQYSYLPSWISYLVDQSKARAAGRDLFDAVYGTWSKLPLNDRPKLYVGGESLGSFGAETAFSGEYDLRNRTSGTLFSGPPNFNTLFREFVDHRDPGSTEIHPVYKAGRTVRFETDPTAAIPPRGKPWSGPRVLYLMHPSDPIVWWSPNLIFREPDWLAEPPGKGMLRQAVWIPLISFWQVTADLPFATGVPAGYGHLYTTEYVNAWYAVMHPPGITQAQLAELRKIIAKVNTD